jgi:hypothetical protein
MIFSNCSMLIAGRLRGCSRARPAGRLRSAVHSPVRSSPGGSSTEAPTAAPISSSWACRHSVSVTTAALLAAYTPAFAIATRPPSGEAVFTT